jgi:ABC-type transporter Mla subunit MlaD
MSDAFLNFFNSLPVLIKVGICMLLSATVLAALSFWCEIARLNRSLKIFSTFLEPESWFREGNRNGLGLEAWDRLREEARKLAGEPKRWWGKVQAAAELYLGTDNQEAYYLAEDPSHVLQYGALSASLHLQLYRAIPGLLTGVGLALTFVAILLALHGVHYDPHAAQPIVGIDTLINGLSGKFASSVVALICSIGFTLFEHSRIRSLRRNYNICIEALTDAIPRLTTARILLDIRKSSADASVEVANISADVVARFSEALNQQVAPVFAASVSQGMAGVFERQFGPTLDKMSGSVQDLQGTIAGLESHKQQSLTSEFERLLGNLERSMTQALEKMAGGFQVALGETARGEFAQIQGTLEGTRILLETMNNEFGGMQHVFNSVITKAEQSSATIVSQAEASSQTMTDRLEHVLQEIGQRSTDFAAASQQLREAQTFLSDMLLLNGENLKLLGAAGAEVRAFTADLRGHAQSLGSMISGQAQVTDRLATAAGRIQAVLEGQDERLQRYEKSVKQFDAVLTDLDKRVAAVLNEFTKGFSDYQESVRNNFDSIVRVANELVPKATLGLEARVEEFSDQMTNFSDAIVEQLQKLGGTANGRAHPIRTS